FKKKLQDLKSIIRLWVKDKKFHLHNAKNSLQNDLMLLYKVLETGETFLMNLLHRNDLNDDCKILKFRRCLDRLKLNAPFHNRLSSDQVDELDRAVSRDEIRRAVWNCGENSVPSADDVQWCKEKKRKKQAMFFKVDFAKAYDSVRWDYLLDILQAFGFGPNWWSPKGSVEDMESIRWKFFNGFVILRIERFRG
ncbi:hypothetical protein Tco_0705887, partial [Tanacetum coccineum]